MIFNKHGELEGLAHAFLSPSSYSWLNYDLDKLTDRYKTQLAAQRGTRYHEFAAEAIALRHRMPEDGTTLNTYVNDAIGFNMSPEVRLAFSRHCFGTADAIKYEPSKKLLLVHDLKMGVNEASMEQLRIYCALFCLEYDVDPANITMIIRIYQNDDVREEEVSADKVYHIMDTIRVFSKHLEALDRENMY